MGISQVCSNGSSSTNLFVGNGKITQKGGAVIHIMSHHCCKKNRLFFIFKASGGENVDEGST